MMDVCVSHRHDNEIEPPQNILNKKARWQENRIRQCQQTRIVSLYHRPGFAALCREIACLDFPKQYSMKPL